MEFNNNNNKSDGKISQEQLYDMLISRELSWKAIINDLIKTEQLDPWNIDIGLLAKKYVEKIRELQELTEGTFFISSKVLLAAALLLRLKSEFLYNNILNLDEILFNKKTKKENEIVSPPQIIELAENLNLEDSEEIEILPRTPLPRARKISLNELMKALDKALNTEHRRIKKTIMSKKIAKDLDLMIPKKQINIRQKIKQLYQKIKNFFFKKKIEKLTFTMLAGNNRDERIACFLPLLYLDNQEKIILEQEVPFQEIEIFLKHLHRKEKLEGEKIIKDK